MVGQGDVVGPHVELPLAQAEDAAQDRAAVYADPHVEVDLGRVPDVPDSLDHAEAHLDAAVRVVRAGDREPADAVVAVAEELYPEAVVLGRELVEPGEEVVQHLHQLLGAALARQG